MNSLRSLFFSVWVLLAFTLPAAAQTVKKTNWHALHSEQGGKIVSQVHSQDYSTLQIRLPEEKSCAALGYPTAFPLVIEDLMVRLPVRSQQIGIAIGAQIVLPRTIHPDTQRPVTYIVPGTKYTGSGNWETLGFWDQHGIPNLLKESDKIASLLQAESKIPFDTRGQYVRQIVLFTERTSIQDATKQADVAIPTFTAHSFADAGSIEKSDTEGTFIFDPLNYVGFKIAVSSKPIYLHSKSDTTEWVSPLQSHVAAPLEAYPYPAASADTVAVRKTYPDGEYVLTSLDSPSSEIQSPAALVHIKFSDGILSLDDVPIGVRAIEYQGEPLEMLRNLQFNAIWLNNPPSPALRQEAMHVGLWIICPPPSSSELEPSRVYDSSAVSNRSSVLDSSYDNVLIWNLGNEGSKARYPSDAQRTQVLQNVDRLKRRPILCTARSGLYEYSRTADILMMFREPLFSSLDIIDLRTWQREYPTLARPDASFWCTVQTQPSPKLSEQWSMFEGNPSMICAVSYEQIKMQIYLALAAGAHGILFTSHTPLTNNDPETEFRRTALELANWELQLVDDWFAAGSVSPLLARSNHSSMSSAVIRASKSQSRLLVPIWQEPFNQSVIGPASAVNVRYVVSGIPETYSAYHLVPGRLLPLESPRVAGGMEIELDEASLNSLIFFCEEGENYAQVEQRAKQMGPRTAYLACRLAELELLMTEQVLGALRRVKDANAMPVHPKDNLPLITMPEYESMLRTTKSSLNFAKNLANRTPPDYARSYLQAEQATRGLRSAGRSLWQEATRHDLNLCMTPVSVSFATLPLYLSAYQRTHGAKLGNNRLFGGDMELQTLEQAGWEPMSHQVERVFVAKKEISSVARRSGQSGLRLAIAPEIPAEKPKQLETVPLWTATPPIAVRAGEMICVNGWIRIPQPLESTVDGLMIFDSLGGEELALRFLQTAGEWQEFVFYRNVPADGNFYVFFAIAGFGEVHLDDIQVAAVQFDTPTPVQPTVPSQQSEPLPYWRRLNPFQYIPPLPGRGD